MSTIVNRRKLLDAAHTLTKTSSPTMQHYEAVANALAQVFSDDTSINCQVVIRWASVSHPATEQKEKPVNGND